MDTFIADLPKLEQRTCTSRGPSEPELMLPLPGNGVALPRPTWRACAPPPASSDSLQSFRPHYQPAYWSPSRTLRSYRASPRALGGGSRGPREIFDPDHTARGIRLRRRLAAAERPRMAKRPFGISRRLIMSFLRHLSEEEAFATGRGRSRTFARLHGIGLIRAS